MPAESNTVASALVVTPDEGTAGRLRDILQKLAIGCIVCADRDTCYEILQQNRFEAAFVDFEAAISAVEVIRASNSSRSAVLLAITRGPEQSARAFEAGVHFVLEQPFYRSALDGTIRAAYGLIIRERRRSFRCPIELSVICGPRTSSAWSGQILNISEGGMCALCPAPLAKGEVFDFEFKLPGSTIPIVVDAEVQWSRDSGKVGLRFLRFYHNRKPDLLHWLANELDKQINPVLASQRKRGTEFGASAKSQKKTYESPKIGKHHSLDHVPTKLRALAETILDENPALKVVFDEQHRSISVSEEFARLLGYSARELVGKPVDELTPRGTIDIDFILKSLHRLKESKGLWLFQGKTGNKLLCSYEATLIADNAVAEFKPLLQDH